MTQKCLDSVVPMGEKEGAPYKMNLVSYWLALKTPDSRGAQ